MAGGDVVGDQVFGVLPVVKDAERAAFDSIHAGVLGTARIEFEAEGGAEWVEEFGGSRVLGVAFWAALI